MSEHAPDCRYTIGEEERQHFLHGFNVVDRRHVRMHFCESGNDILSPAVDYYSSAGGLCLRIISDKRDPPVPDDDRLILQHSLAIHRHDTDGFEYDFLLT